MKIIVFIILYALITFNSWGQNLFIDSLNRKLESTQTTYSEKVKLYNALIEQYRGEMMYEEASSLNKKYLELAKTQNNQLDITRAYTNQGLISINIEEYGEANTYIDSISISVSKTKDKMAKAYSEYYRFYLLKILGDTKKSMEHGLNALSILKETKENLLLEFKLYYQLYGVFSQWNDLENSKSYAQKAIDVALKSGNKNDLSNAYNAMAVVYDLQYQNFRREEDFKKILEYCDKVDSLYNRFPGQVNGYTMSISLNNKASYLLEYSPEITPQIRNEIEDNINKSLKISNKLPYAKTTQTAGLGMLATLAKKDGNLEKAEQYMLQAYSILLAQNPPYYHVLSRVVAELSDIYEQRGNLPKALEYQKQLNVYRTLLFNQNESEVVKKLEIQYQTEKKEQEIQRLKEREDHQKKQNFLYLGLAVIAIIGSFYMFRSYYFRLRYSLEQEKKLRMEKQEAELQIKFEKEEQSRLKIEQELLELKQQKLQDEVLANQLHISHKNNIFKQLKEKIEDNKAVDLKQIIRNENLIDNEFEKAIFQIQEVHPNFFKSIAAKSKQKLTSLDLKYCAYLYLGLDTKQIAQMLNIEPKSVRMTKYRLKQKLALDTNTDLTEYLKNLDPV